MLLYSCIKNMHCVFTKRDYVLLESPIFRSHLLRSKIIKLYIYIQRYSIHSRVLH